MKKLPNYFSSAPQGKNIDRRTYYLWNKTNEIIVWINKLGLIKRENDVLIKVSKMIEKRTGK